MYEQIKLKISEDGSIVIPSKFIELYPCLRNDSVIFETCNGIPFCAVIRENKI